MIRRDPDHGNFHPRTLIEFPRGDGSLSAIDQIAAEQIAFELFSAGKQCIHPEFKIMISGHPDVVSGGVQESDHAFPPVKLSLGAPLNQIAAVDHQRIRFPGGGDFIGNRPDEFQKVRFVFPGKKLPVNISRPDHGQFLRSGKQSGGDQKQ